MGTRLTKAERLPPNPHHPPQLPRRAGQQQVTGEPKGGGCGVNPPFPGVHSAPPGGGRGTDTPRDSTHRFWVSASITMEM